MVTELVVYVDDDSVAYVGGYSRYGPLSVDANSRSVEQAVRVTGEPCDIEIVGYSSGLCADGK